MKFSMDGFRKNLSSDIKDLRDIVECVASDGFYDEQDLVEAMNRVITNSNVINCVYDKEIESFNDISDVEVEHIDI